MRCLPLILLAACTTADAPAVTVTPEPPGANCATGGQKIEVVDGDDTSTSYACNGTDGSPGPGGGALEWSLITGDTIAEPGHGYVATGADPIVLTLPAGASVPLGAEIRAIARDAGDLSIAPTAGEHLSFDDASVPIDLVEGSTTIAFTAWSPDSANQVFVLNTNTGAVVVAGEHPASYFAPGLLHVFEVVASTDASKLFLLGADPDDSSGSTLLLTATTGSTDFVRHDGTRYWRDIAMSHDASRLLAIADRLYLSTNFGTSFAPLGPAVAFSAIAASSDAMTLVGAGSGSVQRSTDGGATWSEIRAAGYSHVTVSDDGTSIALASDHVEVSHDGGATWRSFAPASGIRGVAISADGTRLVAVGDFVYHSADGGAHWTTLGEQHLWNQATVAPDGNGLAVLETTGSNTLWAERDSGKLGLVTGGSVAFTGTGTTIALTATSGTLRRR